MHNPTFHRNEDWDCLPAQNRSVVCAQKGPARLAWFRKNIGIPSVKQQEERGIGRVPVQTPGSSRGAPLTMTIFLTAADDSLDTEEEARSFDFRRAKPDDLASTPSGGGGRQTNEDARRESRDGHLLASTRRMGWQMSR